MAEQMFDSVAEPVNSPPPADQRCQRGKEDSLPPRTAEAERLSPPRRPRQRTLPAIAEIVISENRTQLDGATGRSRSSGREKPPRTRKMIGLR